MNDLGSLSDTLVAFCKEISTPVTNVPMNLSGHLAAAMGGRKLLFDEAHLSAI